MNVTMSAWYIFFLNVLLRMGMGGIICIKVFLEHIFENTIVYRHLELEFY